MATTFGFYILSALAVVSGAFLVTSRNLLHSVLALALASLAIAGLMLTLNAEFLAFVLVLVYVGAVVVLGVFAVMLTGHFNLPVLPARKELTVLAALVSLALTVLIGGVALVQPLPSQTIPNGLGVHELGTLLLTDYMLPFELVSVLLLAALIGALVIARKEKVC